MSVVARALVGADLVVAASGLWTQQPHVFSADSGALSPSSDGALEAMRDGASAAIEFSGDGGDVAQRLLEQRVDATAWFAVLDGPEVNPPRDAMLLRTTAATVSSYNGLSFAFTQLRIVASPDTLVARWMDPRPLLIGSHRIPNHFRLHDGLRIPADRGGPVEDELGFDSQQSWGHLAALLASVARHHRFASMVLDNALAAAEAHIHVAASGQDGDPERDLATLGLHGQAASGLGVCARQTARVCRSVRDELPEDGAALLAIASESTAARAKEMSADVRGVVALATSNLNVLEAERDRRFQTAIGSIAGVVVLPGLLLSLYGANVRGLPGEQQEAGLLILLIASAVLSAVTFLVIRGHRRKSLSSASVDPPASSVQEDTGWNVGVFRAGHFPD